ncbi:MAG: RNA-binding domain-containing protein, partial [Chloroflexota bacterium]
MPNPDFIQSGPGPRVAFFEKVEVQTLAETLVSLANTEGGTIAIGLDEKGNPVKDKVDRAAIENALKEADSICNPPVVVGNLEQTETEKGTVYNLRVPRSIELHALTDGRVLIRSGAKNRPLGGQEILKLASAKNTGDFESEVVPGATRPDFSEKMLEEYLKKRSERTKRPVGEDTDGLLKEVGALDGSG